MVKSESGCRTRLYTHTFVYFLETFVKEIRTINKRLARRVAHLTTDDARHSNAGHVTRGEVFPVRVKRAMKKAQQMIWHASSLAVA